MGLPGEIWLLKTNGVLTPLFMVDQSDEIRFQVIDITGNGIDSVLLRAESSITGGMRFMHWSLVSLVGGKVRVLYSASGEGFWYHNEWIFSGKGPMTDREVALKDIDGDGVLELSDTEMAGAFVSTGPGEDDYELHNTPTKTTVYRFILDKDKNIVSVEEIKGR